jgi:hypothetical protein
MMPAPESSPRACTAGAGVEPHALMRTMYAGTQSAATIGPGWVPGGLGCHVARHLII